MEPVLSSFQLPSSTGANSTLHWPMLLAPGLVTTFGENKLSLVLAGPLW
jgi:hypothetical protein